MEASEGGNKPILRCFNLRSSDIACTIGNTIKNVSILVFDMDLEERVAVLEERTRPKPKHFLDHLKEWGGIATLVVALLYTFPLGVWDRFYLTNQAREAAEIQTIRELALRLAELDERWASAAGNINSPELQTMASRAVGVQKTTLLAGELDALLEHQNALTVPELIMLAYSTLQANEHRISDELYETALEKAQESKNLSASADILRLRAQAFLSRPEALDIDRMRYLYSASTEVLGSVESDPFKLQLAAGLSEWAQVELAKGDWACGQRLAVLASAKFSEVAPLGPVVGQYQQQLSIALQRHTKRVDQPELGCPEGVLERIE